MFFFSQWISVELFTCPRKFHHSGFLWVSVLVSCVGQNVVLGAFFDCAEIRWWWTQWIFSLAAFRDIVYWHKMSQAGEFKAKLSSLKNPHWFACVCVRTPLLPPAILFVFFILSANLLSLLQLPFAPTCQVVSVKQYNRAYSHTDALCSNLAFHCCRIGFCFLCLRMKEKSNFSVIMLKWFSFVCLSILIVFPVSLISVMTTLTIDSG